MVRIKHTTALGLAAGILLAAALLVQRWADFPSHHSPCVPVDANCHQFSCAKRACTCAVEPARLPYTHRDAAHHSLSRAPVPPKGLGPPFMQQCN